MAGGRVAGVPGVGVGDMTPVHRLPDTGVGCARGCVIGLVLDVVIAVLVAAALWAMQ